MKKNPPATSFEPRPNDTQKEEPPIGLNLIIPTSWEQLTQAQAHKLLRLLSLDIPRTEAEVKTAALFILTGIRYIGKSPDSHHILRIPRKQIQIMPNSQFKIQNSKFKIQNYALCIMHYAFRNRIKHRALTIGLTPEEFACILRELEWILQPLKRPWRPDIPVRGLRAKHPLLQGLPFGQWLALENLWAGYLHTAHTGDKTTERKILRQIIGILTERPATPISRIMSAIRQSASDPRPQKKSAGLRLAITNWISALKQHYTRLYPDFYQPVNDSTALAQGQTAIQPAKLREAMNAQIRALTKGDITKEAQILSLPLDRALTELNALAREYKELKAKTAK